jgi:hypothetical protein
MNTKSVVRSWLATTALTAVMATTAMAAAPRSAGLALVPNDAATVAMIRLADARNSPLSSMLFSHADKLSADGDAAKFLADAGLQPTKDIDVMVIATSPAATLGSRDAHVLIIAEGRFNADRLGAALVTRGAVAQKSAAGSYYVMSKTGTTTDAQGAVAFPDAHTAILGSPASVAQALADRANGGTTFITASGLGRELARIDASATAWVLVDVPRASRLAGAPQLPSSNGANSNVSTALKNMSTVAVWATDSGNAMSFGAVGIGRDAETLQLVEDTVRGALSMLRLSVQDKAPDLVSALRNFSVSRSADAVSVNGTVPADVLKSLMAKAHSAHAAAHGNAVR